MGPNIEYSLEWHKDLTSSLSPLANMKEKSVRKCTGKERVISVMIFTIEMMITEVTTVITRMPNVKIIQVIVIGTIMVNAEITQSDKG